MLTYQTDLSGKRGNAARERSGLRHPAYRWVQQSPTGFSTILTGRTDRFFADDSSARTADHQRLPCGNRDSGLVISVPHKNGHARDGYVRHGHAEYGHARHGHAGNEPVGCKHGPCAVRDVDRDDGGHDGAIGGAHDSGLSHSKPASAGRSAAVRACIHLSSRISCSLDRVFGSSNSSRVVVASGCATFSFNGGHQFVAEWRTAYRHGRLSVDTAKTFLPEKLPLASLLSDERMARRQCRRFHHGTSTRRVLPGMLLGIDGLAVRRRGYEFAVGRANCAVRPGREGPPQRRTDCENRWSSAGGYWRGSDNSSLVD